MELLLAFLLASGIVIVGTLYSSFSWGYVASIFYSWFIMPNFETLPDLSWYHFAGIMFFVNCFYHNSTLSYIKDEFKDSTSGVINTVLSPWVLLFCAFIFKIILQ